MMRLLFLFAIIQCVAAFRRIPTTNSGYRNNFLIQRMTVENSNNNVVVDSEPEIIETAEEKYKREKLAEIAEKKAKEVFVTRNTGRYECQACGYVYSEAEGYAKKGIAPGTPFDTIDKFRCPQCGVGKNYFVPETETLSGFKENLKYGLGGNSLTEGQKSNLIFGSLAIGFAILMSGYLLE